MSIQNQKPCDMDMTPMIDCVFQLIIFFIVTINLDQSYKEDIYLEDAPHAEIQKEGKEQVMTVEVDKRGNISLNTRPVSANLLRSMVQARYNKIGEFAVVIRADYRTQHRHVRAVMDICSAIGIYKIQFAAVKEHKGKKERPTG